MQYNIIEKVKSLRCRTTVGLVQVFNNDILYYTQPISYSVVTAAWTEPNIRYNYGFCATGKWHSFIFLSFSDDDGGGGGGTDVLLYRPKFVQKFHGYKQLLSLIAQKNCTKYQKKIVREV